MPMNRKIPNKWSSARSEMQMRLRCSVQRSLLKHRKLLKQAQMLSVMLPKLPQQKLLSKAMSPLQ